LEAEVQVAANTTEHKSLWAIGLMSGTSLDGVDAALIHTDGERVLALAESLTLPYSASERAELFACLEGTGDVEATSTMLALRHAEAVEVLLGKSSIKREEIGLLGFHGQTIFHAPEQRKTMQIGDAALLAKKTGISVVHDFRSRDVAAGGQGAPLVPLYHAALWRSGFFDVRLREAGLSRASALAVLNIGGVANITYLNDDHIIACDTGPGNALIDDWVRRHTGLACDEGGKIAAAVAANEAALERLLAHPFFDAAPPKSLDRNTFARFVAPIIEPMELGEGAATLTAFTAASIVRIIPHLPSPPQLWLVAGGGRHNPTLMHELNKRLFKVLMIEDVGLNGDALEAQAFGFLAVRSLYGLPISLPTTTGVPEPMTGGYITGCD
jgi:anhydro-N-acetylmuramic acid kinase